MSILTSVPPSLLPASFYSYIPFANNHYPTSPSPLYTAYWTRRAQTEKEEEERVAERQRGRSLQENATPLAEGAVAVMPSTPLVTEEGHGNDKTMVEVQEDTASLRAYTLPSDGIDAIDPNQSTPSDGLTTTETEYSAYKNGKCPTRLGPSPHWLITVPVTNTLLLSSIILTLTLTLTPSGVDYTFRYPRLKDIVPQSVLDMIGIDQKEDTSQFEEYVFLLFIAHTTL